MCEDNSPHVNGSPPPASVDNSPHARVDSPSYDSGRRPNTANPHDSSDSWNNLHNYWNYRIVGIIFPIPFLPLELLLRIS